MTSKFQLYDIVRVARPPAGKNLGERIGDRQPRIGDKGTVVMAYAKPHEGYTVEAVAPDGRTEWLADFLPGELEKA